MRCFAERPETYLEAKSHILHMTWNWRTGAK